MKRKFKDESTSPLLDVGQGAEDYAPAGKEKKTDVVSRREPLHDCPRCGGRCKTHVCTRGRKPNEVEPDLWCSACCALEDNFLLQTARKAKNTAQPQRAPPDTKEPPFYVKRSHVCKTCGNVAHTFWQKDLDEKTLVRSPGSIHWSLDLCQPCETVKQLLLQFAGRKAAAAKIAADRAEEAF